MNEGKQTFLELLTGIGFYSVLMIIPGIFWNGDKKAYYLGLAIGIALAIVLIYDMYSSIDRGLDMDAKHAAGYIRNKTIFRIAVTVVIFTVVTLVDQIHILGALLGVFTLKLSAYTQPLTHKCFTKLNKGR